LYEVQIEAGISARLIGKCLEIGVTCAHEMQRLAYARRECIIQILNNYTSIGIMSSFYLLISMCGERAAAIYTLLGTAKLNDLNPETYLHYALERIADHPINKNR
jgi:hypothetical protein